MKLLKIVVVLTLVGVLLLGGALPVLANSEVTSTQPSLLSFQPDNGKPPWARDGKVKVIRGVVKEDPPDNKIEVIVESGDEVEIFVDGSTKYRVPGLGRDATLSDIKQDMQVAALVYETAEGFYARHILVVPSRPVYGHHVGKLLEYDDEDGIIIIEDKWGNEVIFEIGDSFKELPPGVDMEQAEAEQRWVTVITRGHPISGDRVAFGVVVHPPRPTVGPGVALTRLLKGLEWRGLEHISGTIIEVDDMSIIIDPTRGETEEDQLTLECDERTTVIMRGVLSLEEQPAIAFYREGENDTALARIVLVGIEPPEIEED